MRARLFILVLFALSTATGIMVGHFYPNSAAAVGGGPTASDDASERSERDASGRSSVEVGNKSLYDRLLDAHLPGHNWDARRLDIAFAGQSVFTAVVHPDVVHSSLRGMAADQYTLVADWVLESLPSPMQEEWLKLLIPEWSVSDPESVRVWLEENIPGRSNHKLMVCLIRELASSRPDLVLDWVAQERIDALVTPVVFRRLLSDDFDNGVELLKQTGLLQRAREQVVNGVLGLQFDEMEMSEVARVFELFAGLAGDASNAWEDSYYPDLGYNLSHLSLEEVLDLSGNLPESARGELLSGYLYAKNDGTPERWFRLAGTVEGEVRKVIFSNSLRRYADEDAMAAYAYWKSLPDRSFAESVVLNSGLAERLPFDTAMELIRSIPNGPEKDQLLAQQASHEFIYFDDVFEDEVYPLSGSYDPDRVGVLLAQIEDPYVRLGTVAKMLSVQVGQGQFGEARQTLAQVPNIPAEERARLAGLIERAATPRQ